MVLQVEAKPPPQVLGGDTLLGFSVLVAPCSKTASPQNSLSQDFGETRAIYQLLQSRNAPNKMAIVLHGVIRKILQVQQLQARVIDNYIK